MRDFQIIQDATGKAWYYHGKTLPDGCKWNPRPDVERLSGVWEAPEAARVVEDNICEGDKKVPCEVYSRIVGYIRPVQNWNKGKRQEFAERVTYRVPNE